MSLTACRLRDVEGDVSQGRRIKEFHNLVVKTWIIGLMKKGRHGYEELEALLDRCIAIYEPVAESDDYDKRAGKYVVDFLSTCRVLKLVMRPDWENEVRLTPHLLNLLKAKDAKIGKKTRLTSHGMRDVSLAIQDPECECWRTNANLLVSR